MTILTPTEKRVIRNMHLIGCMGQCGRLNKAQRLALLRGLVVKGMLTQDMAVTKSGIEATLLMNEER